VTLSAAAPAGGAIVVLSSSNTAAARVPASVTVSGRSDSCNVTVTTSAVFSSTTVTGLRNLQWRDQVGFANRYGLRLLRPTLSSLTLNPTSVVGGVQSSTGTVTLSAAAPAGGAIVVLSSSNTAAARVPASVTVAAERQLQRSRHH